MQVSVQYISLVKSYTNKSQDEITLPDTANLGRLLDQVAQTYDAKFTTEVYDPNKREMKQNFVAMVNGVLMDQLKGLDTPLKNGDKILLMALVTGG
jgi:MoaD family protein